MALVVIIGILAASASILLAVTIGSAGPDFLSSARILFHPSSASPDDPARVIVLSIRVPRALLGFLVGAALSCAGAAFQALLKNPLADPYVLGISGGAALGAIAFSLLPIPLFFGATPGMGAAIGAFLAVLTVFSLAKGHGRSFTPVHLLLVGVIVGTFCSAVILIALTLAEPGRLRSLLFWLAGDLGLSSSAEVAVTAPFILIGIIGLFLMARPMNLLLAGEDMAARLGVSPEKIRLAIYLLASMAVGGAVASAGSIGFAGLLIPHAIRLVVGPDHRLLIPACAFFGGGLMVLADLAARSMLAPAVIPVGVVTALAGAPLFLILLRKSMGGRQK